MKHYYFYDKVDKYNRHEIHEEECQHLPSPPNRTYIGYFSNCQDALTAAKEKFSDKMFDGCYYCSNSCHRG